MTQISQGNDLATVILDFQVAPENIEQMIESAKTNIEQVMSKKSGFVSASLHKSSDGTRLVNYSQWKNREAYQSALNFLTPDEVKLGEKLLDYGQMNWNFYKIVLSIGRNPSVISKQDNLPTVINSVSVQPKNMTKLIELFTEYGNKTLRLKPGFISANIHKSWDDKQLINYVQWESQEGLENLFDDIGSKRFFKERGKISRSRWDLFKVVSCH